MASCIPAIRLYSASAADLSRRRVQHMLFVATASGWRTHSSQTTPRQPPAEAYPSGTTAAVDPLPDPRNQRVLHAAVAGLPNAGKSTLLNYMVGDKVRGAMSHCSEQTARSEAGTGTVLQYTAAVVRASLGQRTSALTYLVHFHRAAADVLLYQIAVMQYV